MTTTRAGCGDADASCDGDGDPGCDGEGDGGAREGDRRVGACAQAPTRVTRRTDAAAAVSRRGDRCTSARYGDVADARRPDLVPRSTPPSGASASGHGAPLRGERLYHRPGRPPGSVTGGGARQSRTQGRSRQRQRQRRRPRRATPPRRCRVPAWGLPVAVGLRYGRWRSLSAARSSWLSACGPKGGADGRGFREGLIRAPEGVSLGVKTGS